MIGLYNNVTAEDANTKNGNLVNSANKIVFTLNSTLAEEKEQCLAIRTLSDEHKTIGTTTVSLSGETANKWSLSLDGDTWADWGKSISINKDITNKNTIIYIKAKANENESASSDTSVSVKVACTISPV